MTDFASAAGRHWSDAELLLGDQRFDNADQLFGFAAECALKAVLFADSASWQNGEPPKGFRVHVDELWDKVNTTTLRKRYPGVQAVLQSPNPFSNWSTDQRYSVSGTVPRDQVDVHRKMTQRLLGAAQLLGTRSKA